MASLPRASRGCVSFWMSAFSSQTRRSRQVPFGRCRMAVHDREVHALGLVTLELFLQPLLRRRRSARTARARTCRDRSDGPRTAAACGAGQVVLQVLVHRPRVAAALERHRQHARRLVQHDDGGVLVEDRQVAIVAERLSAPRRPRPIHPDADDVALGEPRTAVARARPRDRSRRSCRARARRTRASASQGDSAAARNRSSRAPASRPPTVQRSITAYNCRSDGRYGPRHMPVLRGGSGNLRRIRRSRDVRPGLRGLLQSVDGPRQPRRRRTVRRSAASGRFARLAVAGSASTLG